ncbi:MAG TPA: response regulator [Urbifossiella sp.]|nr:response regulator [Urbifossiella sp.]
MSDTSPSVLVVDDHPDAADSLAHLLRLYGFTVRVAYGPEAALAAAPADAVILELRLPRIDGWEVVRRIRSRPAARHPFFVAVTSCGRDEDRRQSADAGIHLHLLKPVKCVELIELLERFGRLIDPSFNLTQRPV